MKKTISTEEENSDDKKPPETTDDNAAPKASDDAVTNPEVKTGADDQNKAPQEEVDLVPKDASSDLVKKKALVFLGGTCNNSQWRETLIQGLEIAFFNPVVENWTEASKKQEDEIKDAADYHLYTITPLHKGYFSFVEAAISAIRSPSRCVLCVLKEDNGISWPEDQLHSLNAVVNELKEEGIHIFESLDDTRNYLNQQKPVADAATTPPDASPNAAPATTDKDGKPAVAEPPTEPPAVSDTNPPGDNT